MDQNSTFPVPAYPYFYIAIPANPNDQFHIHECMLFLERPDPDTLVDLTDEIQARSDVNVVVKIMEAPPHIKAFYADSIKQMHKRMLN